MTKNFKKILFLLVFVTSIGTTQSFAQKKGKSKAKTHKIHKMRSNSSDNGEYYNGHKIYTGPRGGRYYINSNGKKTYILIISKTKNMLKKSILLVLLFSVAFVLTSNESSAQRRYLGRSHTTSHGGHYSSGRGSSHKGGHYKNSSTSNHYGRHKS